MRPARTAAPPAHKLATVSGQDERKCGEKVVPVAKVM